MAELTVELAFGALSFSAGYPTGPVDVTDFVRSVSISRGSSRYDGTYPPHYSTGTATVVLDNQDAEFDPTNDASTYAGLITPDAVSLTISITHNAVTAPIFTGIMSSWVCDYPAGGHDGTVTVTALDASAVLNAGNRVAQVAVGNDEVTSARIERILDDYWEGLPRSIAPNTGLTQYPLAETTLAGNPWAEIVATADSEPGEVFIAKDGTLVFRDKAELFGDADPLPAYDFSDTGGADFGYQGFSMPMDNVLVRNRIRVTSADAVEGTVDSGDFPQRDLSVTTLFIDGGDGIAQAYANLLSSLLRFPDPRVEELSFQPQNAPSALWPQVRDRELGDLVGVTFHPPGRPSDPIVRQGFIRGISHRCGAHLSGWTTTYALQDASRLTVLIFDDDLAGRFDFGRFSFEN